MISETALRDFKQIWVDEFGTEIPDEVAVEEAINLLTMFNTVYRPLKESDIADYENEDEKSETKKS